MILERNDLVIEILLYLTVWFYIFKAKRLGNDARNFYTFLASVWKWHAVFTRSNYDIKEKQPSF